MTPRDFDAITNAVSVAAIMAGVTVAAVGTPAVIARIRRWWRNGSVAANVEAALPPGRCDWCDGFTMDRRRCTCTEACTFVPLCGAREEVRRG